MIGFVDSILVGVFRPLGANGGKRRWENRRCARMAVAPSTDAEFVEAFGKMVRGEWIGHEVSFDGTTGELEPLADGYIPEEFLNWGVMPTAFESNHSHILRGDTLYRKHTRIIPTVDHFSDHTDVEEDTFIHDINSAGFTLFDCGSYAFAPEKVIERKSLLDKVPRIEVCLRDSVSDPGFRVVGVMRFDFSTGKFFKSQQLFHERYETDWSNGQFIEVGTGYRSEWGKTETTKEAHVSGLWRGENGSERETNLDADITQALLLPGGLFLLSDKTADGEMELELGWLIDETTRITMATKYSAEGDLLGSTRNVERRV
eukprot:CAMPEP_0113963268 /NCGR_PEP_ID=MMETSP0011_2-20120614/6411_1 /TAXON_ID=101924 /ORGANISM="Rhodosorus marinus" /LENGTH=315 /DNA_ID=CAMNT_0000975283 /DNA_START=102 /DNA_END=1049 /DNA_ORIENTATION=- /assembly_acc=CAM_ASM_000156